MRTIKFLFTTIVSFGLFVACSDTWDSHYEGDDEIINNENIISVSKSTNEYIKSEASLSSMYTLFENTEIIETLKNKDHFTLLMVENGNIDKSIDLEDDYLAQTHVSNIAISPANLVNGERVLMRNQKYLTISTTVDEKGIVYYFNNAKVEKIIKTTDGYIYIVDTFAEAPKSLYELLESLGGDYSIFKNMVLSRNQKVFDKNASIPIGVDNTGSTVYDSVFTIVNPYFEAQDFNLTSPALTATLLLPSNKVIEETLETANASLKEWGLERNDSIKQNWIFQSAFFNTVYSKEDFENNQDLKSIFGKQWRTTVQKIDFDNPIQMSNGIAYKVDWMKIPTNVLIYRLKDFFKWYEFLTQEDKEKYFQTDNLTFNKCDTKVAAWSGWPAGGFPYIENRILIYNLTDPDKKTYSLKFTPFQYIDKGGGNYEAKPYLIPPGEYDLCMGFMQRKNNNEDIDVIYEDKLVRTVAQSELAATTFHFDRGGQGYPEGYDTKLATDSKKSNYDRDGGKVGVIEIKGDKAKSISITFNGRNAVPDANFHHWCLKPTANCY